MAVTASRPQSWREAPSLQQAQGEHQVAGEDTLVGGRDDVGLRGGGAARWVVQEERLGRVQFVAEEPGVLRALDEPVQAQRGARLGVEEGAGGGFGRVGGGQAYLYAALPLAPV